MIFKNSSVKGFSALLCMIGLMFGLMIACGGSDDATKGDVQGKIGEKISTDKFELSVTSVKTKSSVGNTFLSEKPAEGGVFIVVSFSSKNKSDKPISSLFLPKIKLIDSNNVKYDNAVGAAAAYSAEANIETKLASDLNPGITQKDADVFEVSKDLWNKGGWKIIIEADKNVEISI